MEMVFICKVKSQPIKIKIVQLEDRQASGRINDSISLSKISINEIITKTKKDC